MKQDVQVIGLKLAGSYLLNNEEVRNKVKAYKGKSNPSNKEIMEMLLIIYKAIIGRNDV